MGSIKLATLVAAFAAAAALTATPSLAAPTGALKGHAALQTKAGAHPCGPQDQVILLPEIAAGMAVQLMFGANDQGYVANVAYPVPDPANTPTAACDANGGFEFSSLAPGGYYAIAHITWADGKAGGSVMKRVEVKAGETADMTLSADAD